MADEKIWRLEIQEGNSITALKNLGTSFQSVKGHVIQVSASLVSAGNEFARLAAAEDKAALAAKRVDVAHAQVAVAVKRASDATASGKASSEQIALAQARAALAAEKLEVAEHAAATAMQKVAAESARASAAMHAHTSSTNVLTSSMQNVGSSFSNFRSSVSGAGGHLLDFTSKIGMALFGLQQLAGAAISVASALLAPNASMEQSEIAFTNLLGSVDAAKSYLKELEAFAASTPFNFPELVDDAQRMMAFGYSARDVIPFLTDIGDAMSAMGKGQVEVAHIVTIFGQMHAAGKLNAGDMMQLTSTGIPAWKMLADSMHISVAELQKMTTEGIIPADDAIARLRAGMHETFGGAMQAQSQSFNGLLSTFQDNVSKAFRAFTGPLFTAAKAGLVEMGNAVSSPAFQEFATMLGEKVGGAIQFIVTFIQTQVVPGFAALSRSIAPFQPALERIVTLLSGEFPTSLQQVGTSVQQLGSWFETVVVPALQKAAPGFSELGSVLINDVLPAVIELRVMFREMANSELRILGSVVSTVLPLLIEFAGIVSGYIAEGIKFLLPHIVSATKAIASFAKEIIERVEPIIKRWLESMMPLVQSFSAWWNANWPMMSGILKGVFEEIVGVVKVAWALVSGIILIGLDLLSGNWGQAWEDLKNMLSGVWDGIQTYLRGALTIILTIFSPIGTWFANKWQEARQGVEAAFSGIGTWFGDRFGEARRNSESIFANIGMWFSDRYKDIQNVFIGIGAWFSAKWQEIAAPLQPIISYIAGVFQTVWNIIVAIFSIAGSWASGVWGTIAAAFSFVTNFFRDQFQSGWNAVVVVFSVAGSWASGVWSTIAQVFSVVSGYFHDRFQEAWNAIVVAFSSSNSWASGVWNGVASAFSVVGGYFHDQFQEAWNSIVTVFSPLVAQFQGWWNNITNGIESFKNIAIEKFNAVQTGGTNAFHGLVNGIVNVLNNGISAVESFINFIGQGLNNVASALGTSGVISVAHLYRIPQYASGTSGHPGGPMLVGEEGPEILIAPAGTTVIPNLETRQLLSGLPAYADGVGDIAGNILSWIAGGAKGILDNIISALHITAPNLGPLTSISAGIFAKVKDWAFSWIDKILPKFDFGGGVTASGDVQSWIAAAMAITRVPGSWAGALATIAMYESGGNPRAVNLTDINAQNGDPSRGLFQTIMATFLGYALPGLYDIYNPIHNAVAAIRYIISRYGTVFNVPGIVALSQGKAYVGYGNGGLITEPIVGLGLRSHSRYLFGERGSELVVPVPQTASLGGTAHNDQAVRHLETMVALLAKIVTLQQQQRNSTTINNNVSAQSDINSLYQAVQTLGGRGYESVMRGSW